MRSRISIRPITRDNWEEAAQLRLLPEQVNFITPNVYSIAESKFHPELIPCAIYAGVTMVGFLMYCRDPEDNQYWLYRFMIDAAHQGQGYGREALALLIERIRQLPDAPELNVSYEPENQVAARLYRNAGFVERGMMPWGEIGAKLVFTTPSST